jgi:hypothetical protein
MREIETLFIFVIMKKKNMLVVCRQRSDSLGQAQQQTTIQV